MITVKKALFEEWFQVGFLAKHITISKVSTTIVIGKLSENLTRRSGWTLWFWHVSRWASEGLWITSFTL